MHPCTSAHPLVIHAARQVGQCAHGPWRHAEKATSLLALEAVHCGCDVTVDAGLVPGTGNSPSWAAIWVQT